MSSEKKYILCVGLNPAFQKVYYFKNFIPGSVNRAYKVSELASGKGLNVGRILHLIKKPIMNTGFLGGETGDFIKHELTREQIPNNFVATKNKTRTCTTIVIDNSSQQTELVEEGNEVDENEVKEFYKVYEKLVQDSGIAVIAGTAPPGVPVDIYYHLIKIAHSCGVPVILDSQKLFLLNALRMKPLVIKPNLKELETAVGRSLSNEENIWKAVDEIRNHGIECVVISNEDKATFVAFDTKRYKIIPPKIEPINAIGSGDAFAAGIASVLIEERDYLKAAVFGTACGSASTLTPLPGFVVHEEIELLMDEIRVIEQ